NADGHAGVLFHVEDAAENERLPSPGEQALVVRGGRCASAQVADETSEARRAARLADRSAGLGDLGLGEYEDGTSRSVDAQVRLGLVLLGRLCVANLLRENEPAREERPAQA